PKGLSMGKVVRVKKKEYGLFQEVEVSPSADFSRLEEVMVILRPASGGKD
ncbi:MAG: rod shape-determining protein MreC, partial [Deltaproteobacteria bacterium]